MNPWHISQSICSVTGKTGIKKLFFSGMDFARGHCEIHLWQHICSKWTSPCNLFLHHPSTIHTAQAPQFQIPELTTGQCIYSFSVSMSKSSFLLSKTCVTTACSSPNVLITVWDLSKADAVILCCKEESRSWRHKSKSRRRRSHGAQSRELTPSICCLCLQLLTSSPGLRLCLVFVFVLQISE